MTDFLEKNVLITGVSSGIGKSQAEAFLARGANVYGIDKEVSKLDHENFYFYQLDTRSSKLTELIESLPPIDILCNTAGILDDYKPFLETSDKELDDIFSTNFNAPVRLTRLVLPKMLENKSGVIINMCSIASLVAGGGGSSYTSSKHALAGFTKQLALDYARSGVQIFGIAPGAIDTPMNKADFLGDAKMAKKVAEETPVGRWAQPSEVADLTMFLASGKAQYMQGAILPLDGGWLLK